MDLREARFKRRITQWALSKISNVHQCRISLIENSEKPKDREKEALAKGLGVNLKEIEWPKGEWMGEN